MKIDKTGFILFLGKYLNVKIKDLQSEMADINAAIAGDTKSSMGDKYETFRETATASLKNLQAQILHLQHQKAYLNQEVKTSGIHIGSLVESSLGIFFIGPALGKIVFDKYTIHCISKESPFGKILIANNGKRFHFNNKIIEISAIY